MKRLFQSKKRIISLFLAVILALGGMDIVLTTTASAADVKKYSYNESQPFFNYYLENCYEYDSDGAPNKWFASKLSQTTNTSNFCSLKSTDYANINGKKVTVDTFYRVQGESLNDPNYGMGILIYQCIEYKVAHPDEDVEIYFSSYRLSATAAVCIDRNSKWFGYMRSLYDCEYDNYGFVRIVFMFVEAAKMGIKVNILPHLNSYGVYQDADNSVGYAKKTELLYSTYFNSAKNTECYSEYADGKKVSDYLTLTQVDWDVEERSADMHHIKTCIVSNYIDKNGVEHGKSTFLTSSNLDDNNYRGCNGNGGSQSGVIISDHDEIYNVVHNYLDIIKANAGKEDVAKFRDYVSTTQTKQIDLIRAGLGNTIPENEKIVYLGSDTDDVFEMYFTPLPGSEAVWDTEYNPYCKYLSEMLKSEDYIVFTWNMPFNVCSTYFEYTFEDVICEAFHKNMNVNNRIYMQFDSFDASKYNDLVVGKDIGFKKVNVNTKKIHSKDILMSYQKDGVRKYVSLITSCNFGNSAFWYRSNSLLIIKETEENHGVYSSLGAASTCGAIEKEETSSEEHNYTKQTVTASETSRGTDKYTCQNCGDVYYENINFDGYTGKTFTASSSNIIPYIFNKQTLTVEAAISLPTGTSSYGGVILGNYATSDNNGTLNIEVNSEGKPLVKYVVDGTAYSYQFNTDVCSNGIKNIAVTIGLNKCMLYVEGVLKESKTVTTGIPVFGTQFNIGNDYSGNESQYFKGTIYYVNIYTDERSATEIKSDIISADYEDEELAVAYNFIASNTVTDSSDNEKNLLSAYTGLSCETKEDRYSLNKTFTTVPMTFEAYIECDADDVISLQKGCTILGNYFDTYLPGISFRIYLNGMPSLCLRYDSTHQDQFTIPTSILGAGKVHVAFTIDDTNVYGYLNGELVLTKAHCGYMPELNDYPFSVGGDIREDNSWWFRSGSIYSLNVFSGYRTKAQIERDINYIDLNDFTLMASYDFTTSMNDRSANHNDIQPYYYTDELLSSDSYDYTIVAVGDTQAMVKSYPEYTDEMYQYIVDNVSSMKIARVIGLGDITNDCTDEQWTLAKNAISKLDGVVPYSLIRGNHDVYERAQEKNARAGLENTQSEKFNEYFDNDTYAAQYDGAYNDDPKNTYSLQDIGGIKYLFINLDYGPSDDVLTWAGNLCETYSDRNVIISTHCFLFRDGTTLDGNDVYAPTQGGLTNDGDDIWNKFASKYENISMILCGHDPSNNIVTAQLTGDNGNTVNCFLIDQQYVDSYVGPSGMLTFLHFSNSGKTVTIETYSTVKSKLYKLNNQITVNDIHTVE